ncbi:hypothetical protein [Xylanimonas ulmi]|uniref:DUF4190 domain-containing protein n=1 Tax=Xylanimonas ulmi TaxID=228973 RepID=A0A4Q7M6T5_9MICO|nr:hypothetical protein [Xylanibacterium ulmi]RZS62328.1 hypothetical protein EV386_2660 [Xylanibacterium ulmi]
MAVHTEALALGDAIGPAGDRLDRYAVASVVLAAAGLVGFMVLHLAFAVLSPIAVVLGVLGARRTGVTGAPGRGAATAGFLIGGVGVVVCIFLVVGMAISAMAQPAVV